MSLLRHLLGIPPKISNSSKYQKTPKMLIFRVFHIPLKYPYFDPYFDPLRNTPKIPLKYSFRKNTIFSENLKNLIFQKIRFFTFLGKPDISGFFIFCKKGIFCIFVIFLIFLIFEKMRKMLDFCVFWYFHKMPIFIKYRFFILL